MHVPLRWWLCSDRGYPVKRGQLTLMLCTWPVFARSAAIARRMLGWEVILAGLVPPPLRHIVSLISDLSASSAQHARLFVEALTARDCT